VPSREQDARRRGINDPGDFDGIGSAADTTVLSAPRLSVFTVRIHSCTVVSASFLAPRGKQSPEVRGRPPDSLRMGAVRDGFAARRDGFAARDGVNTVQSAVTFTTTKERHEPIARPD